MKTEMNVHLILHTISTHSYKLTIPDSDYPAPPPLHHPAPPSSWKLNWKLKLLLGDPLVLFPPELVVPFLEQHQPNNTMTPTTTSPGKSHPIIRVADPPPGNFSMSLPLTQQT